MLVYVYHLVCLLLPFISSFFFFYFAAACFFYIHFFCFSCCCWRIYGKVLYNRMFLKKSNSIAEATMLVIYVFIYIECYIANNQPELCIVFFLLFYIFLFYFYDTSFPSSLLFAGLFMLFLCHAHTRVLFNCF